VVESRSFLCGDAHATTSTRSAAIAARPTCAEAPARDRSAGERRVIDFILNKAARLTDAATGPEN